LDLFWGGFVPPELAIVPTGKDVRPLPRDERSFALSSIKYPSEPVLDVGTGDCACLASILASQGRPVVAVDKDRGTIRAARRFLAHHRHLNKAVRLLRDDITASDLPSSSFRNIVCFNVLHHVSPLDSALDELHRILTGDGRVIISDFDENGDGYLERLERGVDRRFRNVAAYRRSNGRRLVLSCEK
jgi:2-polyprenyl-3-methyl-5-hydroxy-6-metoxy-1,4-benzoquinol methylase